MLLIAGIPLSAFIISMLFALLKSLDVVRVFSSLTLFFGFLILFLNLLWYLVFTQQQNKIGSVLSNPPIKQCPSCHSNLKPEETRITSKLGIPQSDINLECPQCFTRLRSPYPFINWIVEEINQKENPEFAWLYAAETLATSDLKIIATGKHTKKAIMKLRAQELGKISDGNFNSIRNLMSKGLIIESANVKTNIYPKLKVNSSQFTLQKDEIVIITSSDISLQRETTRNNLPYQSPVDVGLLIITNKRFAFFGRSKQIVKRLADIGDIRQKKFNLFIYLKGRKTADIFVNLDESLYASILEGMTRKA